MNWLRRGNGWSPAPSIGSYVAAAQAVRWTIVALACRRDLRCLMMRRPPSTAAATTSGTTMPTAMPTVCDLPGSFAAADAVAELVLGVGDPAGALRVE